MSEAEKPHADRAVETSDTAGDGPIYANGAAAGGKAKSAGNETLEVVKTVVFALLIAMVGLGYLAFKASRRPVAA